jgi:Skp family chaperone for outer membrane proteins
MKSFEPTLSLGLPALLCLGAGALWPNLAPRPADAVKVGVVDLDRVLKNYPGAVPRQKEFAEMRDTYNRQLEEMRRNVEALQSAAAILNEGTEEHQKATLEYEIARLRYDETVKILMSRIQRRLTEDKIELYDEIRRGIIAFGQAQKLDLVLRIRETSTEAGTAATIDANGARDVMYHDPAIDQTDAIGLFLKSWTPKPDGK